MPFERLSKRFGKLMMVFDMKVTRTAFTNTASESKKMEIQRKKYVFAEIDIINLNVPDVITASIPQYPDDGSDEGGIGGGMDNNGWT